MKLSDANKKAWQAAAIIGLNLLLLIAVGESQAQNVPTDAAVFQAQSNYRADTELLARFIAWKSPRKNRAGYMKTGRMIMERMADSAYPDTVSANVFRPEFSGFSKAVFDVVPDSQAQAVAAELIHGLTR